MTEAKKRGRPKGSRNKLSFDLKAVMSGKMTEKAMRQLERMLEDPDTPANVRLKAVEVILAYGHGKPQQNQMVGIEAGPNLKELMVRFMAPGETMKEIREANSKVIEHLDPDNTKRKAY
jgi:hypothetical protein